MAASPSSDATKVSRPTGDGIGVEKYAFDLPTQAVPAYTFAACIRSRIAAISSRFGP
jgi:hypothetical protein